MQVLLIEDNIDAAILAKSALGGGGHQGPEIEWVESLESGLKRLKDKAYDAILLDLNLPDSEGFETFTRIRRAARSSAVIVLTGDQDDALALRSVSAGAEEYLLKTDITPALLSRRLRYAVERNRANRALPATESRLGKLVPLLGAKGGCGTTTLCINIGYALQQLGKSVIGVELGDEAGFSGHLSLPPQSHAGWITGGDVTAAVLESSLTRLCSGFSLLCGPGTGGRPSLEETAASGLIQACRRKADYVLVDCQHPLGAPALAILKESPVILLLVERSFLGLRFARKKIEALSTHGIPTEGLLAVIINKSAFLESVPIDTLRKELRCDDLVVIPPAMEELSRNSAVLATNDSAGEPLFADSIRRLAAGLLQRFADAGPGERERAYERTVAF